MKGGGGFLGTVMETGVREKSLHARWEWAS